MKCKKLILSSIATTLFLTSCATTSVKNENSNSTTTVNESTKKENTNKSKNEKVVVEPTPEEIFLEDISNVFIKFTATPKITNVNKAFSSPYTVKVTDKNEVPLTDYILTVSYPSSKVDGVISFTEMEVTTDANGEYSFTPEKQTFGCDSQICIYPTPLNDSVKEQSIVKGATASWKVRSDIINKGAVLFIWDYNEKERPITNSYEVLSQFRSRGMTMVGNAPINETSYIGKPLSTLYKENYEIIENAYGYLIVGTIKFTKPVEPTEDGDGYLCSLVADIQAVSMKNGNKVFETKVMQEAIGKNWNACVSECKDKLAEKVVDQIVYGL